VKRRRCELDTGQAFIERSRHYLSKDYLPKIKLCLENLSDEQLWWRPNAASNSVGNLLLHLAGNVRQWVVSGIGGAEDVRRRQEEFDERGEATGEELLQHLEETLAEVDGVLAHLPASELSSPRIIQGLEVTVLDALYHVVEHFSMHTGQIIYIAKLSSGRDLGFWEIKGGKAIPSW
jgi:uncharacterized damage-inducible protein DinB